MTILVQDSFDRADSTTAIGTSTSGHTYTTNVVYGISSNEAYNVPDTSGGRAVITNVGATDNYATSCAVKGQFVGSSIRVPHILFRYINSSNFMYARFAVGGNLELHSNLTGTDTAVASVPVTLSDNTYYTLKAACRGNNIKIYVDDVLYIDYTMTAGEFTAFGAAAGAGLRFYKTGSPTVAGRWDNLLIETIDGTGTPGSTSYATKQVINRTASLVYATKQAINQVGSAANATKQAINRTGSIAYATKQAINQTASAAIATKQVIAQTNAVAAATKQSIYQIGAISYATQQTIASGGIPGSVAYSTKQILSQTGAAAVATKQTVYRVGSIDAATKQAIFVVGYISYPTCQAILDSLYDQIIMFNIQIQRGLTFDAAIKRSEEFEVVITRTKNFNIRI